MNITAYGVMERYTFSFWTGGLDRCVMTQLVAARPIKCIYSPFSALLPLADPSTNTLLPLSRGTVFLPL